MKANRGTLFVVVLIAMTMATNLAKGQAIAPDLQPGLMPYQSYHGGDIDKINLSNGIVNVDIPLISYPQRGGKLILDFTLAFNSKPLVYQKFCTPQIPKGPAPTCNWSWLQFIYGQSDYLTGWRVADMQSISRFSYDEKVPISNGPSTTDYDWIQIQTGDGSIHPSGQISGSTGQITLDGSNFASVGGSPTAGCAPTCYILDANGVMYNNTSWTSVIREDPDGNEISLASGSYTDTVGRSIPIFPTPTTTFTNQQAAVCKGSLPVYELSIWQVPGVNGGTQTYTFCYAQVPYLVPNPNQSPYTQSGNLVELQSVALPNGLSWVFGYDATNGTSTAYGDLTSITFPTGGTISYTYQSIQSTASPTDHTTRWVATRTENANDGQGAHNWQYGFVLGTSAGGLGQSSKTTTVTDPYGNQVVHNFSDAMFDGYETLAQYYNGSSSSGSLLRSVATNYNYIPATGYFYPAQVMNVFPSSQTTTLDNGLASVKTWSYCCSISLSQEGTAGTYGLPSDEKDYDFASSGTGTLLKEKQTTYEFQTNANYLTANLLNLKASEEILNGSGAEVASDSYTYDESNYSGKSSGITTQHTSAPFLVRGDLTTTTAWLNGGTSPQSHTTWYDTGEAYQSIDPLGHTTTYAYSGTYAGSLPTTVTNAFNQVTTYTYDFNTGQKTSVTDANSQVTTYSYNDPLGRVTNVVYPDVYPNSSTHGQSTYTYNDTASPVNFIFTRVMSPSQSLQEQVNVDGFGREWYTELTTDPQGPVYTAKTYDSLGRLYQEWNPTRCVLPGSTSCAVEATWGTTTHQYDALSRPTVLTYPDGSTQKSTFTGNTIDFYDETSRHWQRTNDALGRLTKVLEPNSSNSPALETDYQYDAANNLLRVDQWGGSKGISGDRVRTFTYDSLSRLLCASNPENSTAQCPTQATTSYTAGTVGYVYDLSGKLTSKEDARGITTTYTYDALNRLIGKTYSDGTQSVAFAYDGKDQNGNPISGLSNTIGRLSKSTNNVNAASIYSYDPMGRIASKFVCIPGNCSYSMGATAAYDVAGDMTNSHLATGLAVGMSYDAAARLNSVTIPTNNPPSTQWSNPTYGPMGLARATLGNGLLEEVAYDNRGRITTYAVGQAPNSTPGGAPPFGNVDLAVNAQSGGSSVPVGGFVKVEGWAASTQDGAPVAQVVVLLDGKPLGSATLGGSRPDVASYYNQSSFTNSGFAFTGSIGNVATGTHTITAVAYDWNQNSVAVATAIQITVTSDSSPVGNVDTVTGVATGTTTVTSGGLITALGWAADNEDGSPVAKVVVLLDGQPIGDAALGGSRSDVAATYNNPAWGKSGWSLTGSIFGAATGTHTVTAAAYDSSGNQTILNSYTISVVANSNSYTGNLESVANASNSGSNSITMGGSITASGWAAEPDQNPGAPLSRVEIDIDGQYLGLATLGIARPDVKTTTGRSDYLDSGFSFTGPITNVDPGEHEIEARVYTHSGGSYILGSSNIVVAGSMPALAGTVVPTRYSYSINYAPNGNVLNAGDSVNGSWSYTYDTLNRLISAVSPTTGISMTYDAFGNRWQQTATAGSAPQPEVSFNGTTNRIDGTCYDAAGNVLDDGPCANPHRYSYDGEGRLISGNYGATTYLYDAEGYRVAKQGGGSTSNVYFYDVAGRKAVETDGSLNVLRTEIYAGNRHLATYQGSGIYYTHTNWLGTEAARSDGSGNLCETISSLPFGDAQQTSGTCSPSPNFFTGKERDTESGLDYFGARYYTSTMGRWMSPDWASKPEAVPYSTLDNPQSLNLYGYVLNNPLSHADADGHCCESDFNSFSDHPGSFTGSSGGDGAIFAPIKQFMADHPVLTNLGINLGLAIITRGEGGEVGMPRLTEGGEAVPSAPSMGAAQRQAMQEQGIPTSQQPTTQTNTDAGKQYTYEVPKPGGGTETKIVQRNTGTDSSHPGQPHVEAGSPKANGQTDSIGRPRLDSNKTKVNVKKPDGQ
jgi:RHS repeat-associated protein